MSSSLGEVHSADAELLMVGVAHGLGQDGQAGRKEVGGDGSSGPEQALDHWLHCIQGLIDHRVGAVQGCNCQSLQNAPPSCNIAKGVSARANKGKCMILALQKCTLTRLRLGRL